MALLRPDPSFYPSPRLAMQAPPERLAYVAGLNPPGSSLNDAILVIDVDPASTDYGQRVGETVLPYAGDELHHFGWTRAARRCVPMLRIPTSSDAIWWCQAFAPRESISSTSNATRGAHRS